MSLKKRKDADTQRFHDRVTWGRIAERLRQTDGVGKALAQRIEAEGKEVRVGDVYPVAMTAQEIARYQAALEQRA